MPWTQILIQLPDELQDAVVAELVELGAAGVWENGAVGQGTVEMTAYFEGDPDLPGLSNALRQLYRRTNHGGEPFLHCSPLEDRDWSEEWKKSWSSFALGSRFFVVPSWSSSECPEGRMPIFIDPGQAFGTGTHETTQLTLESLERWATGERIVLDLGTGSGILAIAAALLGARRILACDNDPIAIEVAAENVERNVPGRVELMTGSADAIDSRSIDLLLCNLTADTIEAIFPEIERIQREGAVAIFSGILNSQADNILRLLHNAHCTVIEHAARGEWCCITTRKDGSQIDLHS